jgi:hypothetical protein
LLGQTVQVVPAEPHDDTTLPATQVPPEQQPPWHTWFTLQEVVQRCSVPSQA